MAINNSEDLNKYYRIINELVDNYVEKHKIKPSRLINYLSPGSDKFKKFLMKNQLEGIKGSDTILKDILLDRSGMEEDGVYTFESYKYFESNEFKIENLKSCLYKGIDKADIKKEKVLADYFDLNLGDIDILDADKNKFKINDWQSDDWEVVVYNSEDISIIKKNIIEFVYDKLSQEKLSIIDNLEIELNSLIKKDIYEEKLDKMLSEEKLLEIITTTLDGYKYEKNLSDHYLWIK